MNTSNTRADCESHTKTGYAGWLMGRWVATIQKGQQPMTANAGAGAKGGHDQSNNNGIMGFLFSVHSNTQPS